MGGRPCSICTHAERAEIDRLLASGTALPTISKRFGMSVASVFRHRSDHLAATMAKANQEREAVDQQRGEDLTEQVRALRSKAMSILLAAERSGDLKTALAGIREARACVELLMEAERLVDRRPTVSLLVAPEWLTTRTVLLDALRPFPEARSAVADRLLALEDTPA